jgi:hypothetical protein
LLEKEEAAGAQKATEAETANHRPSNTAADTAAVAVIVIIIGAEGVVAVGGIPAQIIICA